MRDDFAVFILSNGRPEVCGQTLRALTTKARYAGKWFIILDTDDHTAPEYETRWGSDRILYFDKAEVADTFDIGDNAAGATAPVVVYARNAVDGIAAGLGLSYYMVLDDDYSYFGHRLPKDGTLSYAYTYHLEDVIEAFIEWLEASGATAVAFGQGGDYSGGLLGSWLQSPVRRKAMNTFICKVGRPVRFVGRLNEDVNTYVWRGMQGEIFLTDLDFFVVQKETQQQAGGLTTAYLDVGTYVKSFYTVLWAPSCTKISTLGDLYLRIHHSITWNYAVPKILSGRYKQALPEGATSVAS